MTNIRWGAVLLLCAGAVASAIRLLPADLDWRWFAGAAAFTGAANVVYAILVRRLSRPAPASTRSIRGCMLAQVLTDFMALSVITYSTGTIETPILMLFLPHVILLSLFFPPRISLLMTLVALLFAALPLALELSGIVPTISILGLPFKERIISEPAATVAFIGGIASCYFFCWYLTSTITSSLALREKQVEAANEALIRLDREKTLATLRSTHEMKAPFAAIQGYVYTLRDGILGPLPEKVLAVLDRIDERCNRLRAMITDIIHLGNLRSAVVLDGDFGPVDLAVIVAEEAREIAVAAQPRGIRMEMNLGGRQYRIRAAEKPLRTMVSNLLSNAVKYSHDGGAVDVSLEESHGTVTLRIQDHGIGIPAESLPKIFDDYFRTNAAVRHNPLGNGLGLAMVKEIAKLHDAVIDVVSEEGQGALFSVGFRAMKKPEEGEAHGKGSDR